VRFFCCCNTNTPCSPCPARPADFATRDYRIFIPAISPGQFGKPNSGGNPNADPCADNVGYDHGYCAVHEPGAFLYASRRLGPCPPGTATGFCFAGYGPNGGALGGVVSPNIVPYFAGLDELGRDPVTLATPAVIQWETPGGGAPAETRITLVLDRRCDAGFTPICSSSCANRMWISVGWAWFASVTYVDASCVTQTTTLAMSKAGTYVSDPFVGAFPETLYLKSASVRPSYVPPTATPGDWGCGYAHHNGGGNPGDFFLPSVCPLSYQADGQLAPPFEIPTTISIQRYA